MTHANDTSSAARPPLSIQLANLLISSAVQSIRMRFGAIQILPEDYRSVAFWLREAPSQVKAIVSPELLNSASALAGYMPREDTFVFESDNVLQSALGRGYAVHESTHAVTDLKDFPTLGLSEEAACFLAGAWYHVNTGTESEWPFSQRVLEIASAARERARQTPFPVEIPLADRIEARRIVRKEHGYKPKIKFAKNGIPSRR